MKNSSSEADPASQSSIFNLQSSISWLGAGSSILIARGSDAALRFALFLATARVLLPGDFSLYALLTAALAICQWTLSLGAPRVALFFYARGRRGPLFAWLYLLTLTASLLVIALLAAPPLRRLFFAQAPPGWIILGLSPLPFSLLTDSLAATLLAAGRTRSYGATLWMRNGGTALVLASSLWVHERLLWILAGRLLVQAAVAATTALAARARPSSRDLAGFCSEALRYGVPTAASDALLALHRRADVFLLSAFGRGMEIGGYALAYALGEAFWLVTDSLEAALFVDITKREDADARDSSRRALRLYAAVGAAGFVVGLAAAEGLVRLLFAARYPAAAALLPWTLAAAVTWGVSRPLSSFLFSRGRVRTLLACNASALLVNLLANILLIPRLGAKGAALASFISYALDLALLWIAFTRSASEEQIPGSRR